MIARLPFSFVTLLLLCGVPFAQDGAAPSAPTTGAPASEVHDARLESPRATVVTFLRAVNDVRAGEESAWDDALDCLDLANVTNVTAAGERRFAVKLWATINRIRLVDEQELPALEGLEPAQDTYIFFPRHFSDEDEAIVGEAGIDPLLTNVELTRDADGDWRFSAATMASLNELYTALAARESVLGVDEWSLETEPWLRKLMPVGLTRGRFLELEYWQWLGLLILALIGKTVDTLLRHLVRPIIRRVIRHYHGEASDDAVRAVVRPLGLLASGIVWLLLIRTLGFGGAPLQLLLAAIGAFTILAGTWTTWSLTDLVGEVMTLKAARTESTIDDVLVPLLTKTVKTFIVAFGIVYAAQSLHFNIVPLITGLGIGGLAFAFAAKDTIENLFGSIAVILDRPFEVGDWVVIGDTEGTVEDMGFRSTRIRTFYNSQITMPNSALVRAVVDNYGRRTYRRWRSTLGVQYDTTPDQLIAFTEGIRELIRAHPYTRKDYYQVWCNDFGDSSLNVMLYMFFDVPDWSTELRERERLFVDIVRLADHLGVQFAFPTQTVHLFRGGSANGPQHEPPGSTTDRRSLISGARAAQELVRNQPWRDDPPGPVSFGAETRLEDGDPRGTTEDTRSRPSAEPPPS
jgi:MscS family membrane protein